MKKLLFVIMICSAVASCAKVKSSDVSSPESATPSTKGEIKATEKVIDENDFINVDIYDHVQTLEFNWSGYDTKVLKNPITDEVIYTIQKGDKIEISKVIEFKSTNKTFIKVKLPSGVLGYILISRNPYQNGEYSFLENININGEEIKTLKMTESFQVSDGIFMKLLPVETAENIHETTHEEGAEYYQAIAITSDYQWVKIRINEFIGWVPANVLSVARGGPTINTPEAVVFFDLIGGNEI